MKYKLIKTSLIILSLSSSTALSKDKFSIGEISALIAESSSGKNIQLVDGKGGVTNFPYINKMKAIATVGEIDKKNGKALTGYPDGNAAWLHDDQTIRVAYQSESYATMSQETYPWRMKSGVSFTGSHIHYIDYNRSQFADFIKTSNNASSMVKRSGHLFDRVYNQFGVEVMPKDENIPFATWGNQTLPDGTLVEFDDKFKLNKADYFFQSFCGAWYEQANRYGEGIGFADDVWLTAEEWNIKKMFKDSGIDTGDTMGLASVVVDLKNRIAYTAPALGQSGYEKIMPINSKHKDYVVLVLAGYNHGVEPAPLKIYVGKKHADAFGFKINYDQASERDKFLARNGLLYGKIYGMALENSEFANLGISTIDLQSKMFDNYLMDQNAPNNFNVRFYPTSYQWEGWTIPVSVNQTEVLKWQDPNEQPENYTFFVGDSKTEHPAVDPDIKNQRWLQNMTHEGGLVGFELTDFLNEINKAKGELPEFVSAKATRLVASYDGALTLDVGNQGEKHTSGTHATDKKGIAKMTAPDGLYWSKTTDGDVVIVDEDSGNSEGERKYSLVLNSDTFNLMNPGKGYFLAQAGGKNNPRAKAQTAVYPGSFKKAKSSEFSGSWNITALVKKKGPFGIMGFHTMDELKGTGMEKVNQSTPLSESLFLGVVQHSGEQPKVAHSDLDVDNGGQLFIFNMNLPNEAMMAEMPNDERKKLAKK